MKNNLLIGRRAVGGVVLLVFLLVLGCGYLVVKGYLSCLSVDFKMCANSKIYTSELGLFTFRYPKDYPLTHLTGEKLKKLYNGDFGVLEWANFSMAFYPNAGGERLGAVMVEALGDSKTLDEYLATKFKDYELPPIVRPRKIGGQDARCSDVSQQPHSFTPPSYDCYIVKDGKLYWLSFEYNDYYHKLPVKYYQTSQDIILATFRFL